MVSKMERKKRIRLRYICVALLFAMLLPAMFACEGKTVAPVETTDQTETGTGVETDTGTAEPPEEPLVLTANGKALYCIVYDADLDNGAQYQAGQLAAKLLEQSGNKVFFTRYNLGKMPQTGYHYLFVGEVSGYTEPVYQDLKYGDYKVTVKDGNIYLCGYTEDMLGRALEYFYPKLFQENGELCVTPSVVEYAKRKVYQLGEVKLGNNSIKQYRIVWGDIFSKAYAEKFAETLGKLSGYNLPVVQDTAAEPGEYEFLFGKTNRNAFDEIPADGYTVRQEGNKLKFLFSEDVSAMTMISSFMDQVYNFNPKQTFQMEDLATEWSTDGMIRMATYNVLYGWPSDENSRGRKICDLVRLNRIDILCLQEYTNDSRHSTYNVMSQLGDLYSEVTVTGQNMDYVWCPIFYNKDKFELLDCGIYDMYAEGVPCTEYFTSSGQRNTFHRKFHWCVLRDRQTGIKYIVGNMHPSAPPETHPSEAAFILSKINAIRQTYPDITVLLAGDYNSYQGATYPNGVCGYLQTKGGFSDTYDLAKVRGRNAGGLNIVGIDHILTIPSKTNPITVSTSVSLYLRGIDEYSDHTPMMIAFRSN